MSNPENKQPNHNKKVSIDEKIANLDDQIEWFYGDDFSLDAAVEKYRAATRLAQEIETDLNQLKNEIEVLSQDFSAA